LLSTPQLGATQCLVESIIPTAAADGRASSLTEGARVALLWARTKLPTAAAFEPQRGDYSSRLSQNQSLDEGSQDRMSRPIGHKSQVLRFLGPRPIQRLGHHTLRQICTSTDEAVSRHEGRLVADNLPPCYHYSHLTSSKRMRRHVSEQPAGPTSESMTQALRIFDFPGGAPATIPFESSLRLA
jgi:hypothetical protein